MWSTASMNSSATNSLLLAAFGALYPFLVYAALGRVPAGALVLVAMALLMARIASCRGRRAAAPLVPALAAVALATGGLALADADTAARAYPVLMSLGIAGAFGLSLVRPPTLVESFAALTDPDPSPAARAYMRKVTIAWTLFLLANAVMSAATVALGDLELWTLYNGLLSYLLMGTMFAVELAIRRRVRRRAARP